MQVQLSVSSTGNRVVTLSNTLGYRRSEFGGIDCALCPVMKEVGTGFLMLMVCGALYLQSDPMIWNSLVHLLGPIVG
jgi:hypothetical protein